MAQKINQIEFNKKYGHNLFQIEIFIVSVFIFDPKSCLIKSPSGKIGRSSQLQIKVLAIQYEPMYE